MSHSMSPLEAQLKRSSTVDPVSRKLAIASVDAMMTDAGRATALLSQARIAAMQTPGGDLTTGRSATLAREAYAARTNAEVAKFRAAYALMAEDEGTKASRFKHAAQLAKTAKEHSPLIERVKYHEKRRDLMLQAANATSKALRRIPPLPKYVTRDAQSLPSTRELLASPTLGFRPRAFSDLTGNFYPDDVRAAAGALQGAEGTPPPAPPVWWASLQQAIGFGVKTAGEAAADEGQKTATQNPTGGNALNLTGGILNTLSKMIGGNSAAGGNAAAGGDLVAKATTPWGTILLVGGGLAAGGYLLFRMTSKGK